MTTPPPVDAVADVGVLPAGVAPWEDLKAVFGTRGDPARRFCQRYKTAPGESWASIGADELAPRLRAQTDRGRPGGAGAIGLVAFLDDVIGRPSKRRAVVRVDLP